MYTTTFKRQQKQSDPETALVQKGVDTMVMGKEDPPPLPGKRKERKEEMKEERKAGKKERRKKRTGMKIERTIWG